MNRKAVGGAALVVAGGFLGRETLVWGFNRLLDVLSAGVRGGVGFASLSWQNGTAISLVVIGMVLVLWPRPKPVATRAKSYTHLYEGAKGIIRRVRAHRGARYFMRDRLEPISDIVRAGDAVLLSFAKAGFHVPTLDAPHEEQIAVGQEAYFACLIQLIGRGHFDEAILTAATASEEAMLAASSMHPRDWFTGL
jgi:hypothetical protein